MSNAIAHVVGARPNFVKAAPVIRALERRGARQRLIHTGQHYSEELSGVFFRELGLPEPDVNLGIGSGTHATQTAAAMVALERHLLAEPAALLVIYGDVNSTLAAALAAAKIGLSVAHVEAGLRSGDRSMPEEINRIVADALADLLFTTSLEAGDNLLREGVPEPRVHFVGNPMIDTLLRLESKLEPERVRTRLGAPRDYGVVTLHRPSNVDELGSARSVSMALSKVASQLPLVMPLHPRGRSILESTGLVGDGRVLIVEPLGYLDFVSLVAGSRLVVTDSGGVQEETTILGVPCLTLRPNTERPVTITHGTNRLVSPESLVGIAQEVLAEPRVARVSPPPLWDGRAGERIAESLLASIGPVGHVLAPNSYHGSRRITASSPSGC